MVNRKGMFSLCSLRFCGLIECTKDFITKNCRIFWILNEKTNRKLIFKNVNAEGDMVI